jgi:repressor LexA
MTAIMTQDTSKAVGGIQRTRCGTQAALAIELYGCTVILYAITESVLMLQLTARQQQVLDLIRKALRETGYPPTRAEIAQSLGFRSANAAEDHLRALEKKGVIELAAGASRGIRLLDYLPEQSMLPIPMLRQLTLPLIGRVAAGSPILAQEHVERELSVGEDLFSQRPDYLLKVRGMSMRDAGILDGDLLAVKKTSDARDHQIIVARVGEDVTVKRFMRHRDHIELIAENPDYAPIIVDRKSPGFAVEGLAVGLIRGTAGGFGL